MIKLKQITDFLESELVAIAGVSRNQKKFGYIAFKELKDKGLNIIPINPHADEIYGTKVFKSISDLPQEVNSLIVLTNKKNTEAAVKEALNKGIQNIWIQQMSETKQALKLLEGKNVNLITGECVLMFYKPHSIHKFHRFLKKLFGNYPK